jgi:hypothetical protein
MLDPRYKLHYFGEYDRDYYRRMLEKEVEKGAMKDNTTPVHTSLERKVRSDTEVDEFLALMEKEKTQEEKTLPETGASTSMQSDLREGYSTRRN